MRIRWTPASALDCSASAITSKTTIRTTGWPWGLNHRFTLNVSILLLIGDETMLYSLAVMNFFPDIIKEPVLRELVQVSGTVGATVVGKGNGFAVVVRLGQVEKTLVTSRGRVRLFASLDTAGSFVRGFGISRFDVDMTRYESGRLRGARPDRAAALRLTRTKMQQQPLSFLNQ